MTNYPDGIATVLITAGRTISVLALPVSFDLSIEPSERLVHESSGTILSSVSDFAQSGEPGKVSFFLPAVDQPGFIGPDGAPITHWSYLVKVTERRLKNVAGGPATLLLEDRSARQTYSYRIQPTLDDVASGIDLDLKPIIGATRRALRVWMGAVAAAPEWAELIYDPTTDPTQCTVYARSENGIIPTLPAAWSGPVASAPEAAQIVYDAETDPSKLVIYSRA